MDPVQVSIAAEPTGLYIVLGVLAATTALLVLTSIILLVKEYVSNTYFKGVGKLLAASGIVAIVTIAVGAATVIAQQSNSVDALMATIAEVEQSAGVDIIVTDDLTYSSTVQGKSVIPVSFEYEGDLFNGVLYVEDGTIQLQIPNQTAEDRMMVPFSG